MNILRAIGFTFLVILTIVLTIAILYISMWVMIGIFVVGIGISIYKVLEARNSL